MDAPYEQQQPKEQSISWQVVTHEHKERSVDWYWALGLVAVVGAALAVFFGDFLFAIILLVGVGSIAVLAMRGPREHWVRVDSRGISMDGTLYRYPSIQSFWVEPLNQAEGQHGRLLITTNGIFSPQLVVPLDNATRAQNVRNLMKRFAQEEEQEAHLGEHLAELFGL